MALTIHSARLSDATYIADRMRHEDVTEVTAMGSNPYDALVGGMAQGAACFCGIDKDQNPVLMFGAAMISETEGCLWLLGTDEVRKHPVSMFRQVPLWIGQLFAITGADSLHNLVWEGNETAIYWLRKVGANFSGEPQDCGGIAFLPFEFQKEQFLCAPSSSPPSSED